MEAKGTEVIFLAPEVGANWQNFVDFALRNRKDKVGEHELLAILALRAGDFGGLERATACPLIDARGGNCVDCEGYW